MSYNKNKQKKKKKKIWAGSRYIYPEIFSSWFEFVETIGAALAYVTSNKDIPSSIYSKMNRLFYEMISKISEGLLKKYLHKDNYKKIIKLYEKSFQAKIGQERTMAISDFETGRQILSKFLFSSGLYMLPSKKDIDVDDVIFGVR